MRFEMADLALLIEHEIPEGRQSLRDSYTNLERVAEYCESNYFQSENKRGALEETKNYTTQSLASVAYQINTLAFNFLQMLDLQTTQLAEMESHINHIAQMIMIHKEKVARREIGVLTTNKSTTRQHKIVAPANPERPIKYIRKPIDYTILDDVGHGIKMTNNTPRTKRPTGGGPSTPPLNGQSGPPPTTKPPTPPQPVRAMGTLAKGSREYRALAPPVAPPQVPSNYAPNYPLGHPRSQEARRERGSGYGSLPMMSNQMLAMQQQQVMAPQVGMVHPITHNAMHQQNIAVPPSPTPQMMSNESAFGHQAYGAIPPPPPPVHNAGGGGDYDRQGNASPPLPPPPDDEQAMFLTNYTPPSPPVFGQGGDDGPTWVPKNYIEKVIAIYDYTADKDDELSFAENSVIYVVKKNDDGWYEGVMDGVTGLFPGNYVEPCYINTNRSRY